MKILITGSTGFIGKRVVQKLDERHVDWVPFKGDVTNAGDFESYKDCNAVLHLAAIVKSGPSRNERLEMTRVNVMGTLNALYFAAQYQKAFYYAGSYIYGQPKSLPIHETAETGYHNSYAFTKWYNEQAIFAMTRFFDLNGIIFRIFNTYGPNQPEGFLMSDLMVMIREKNIRLKEVSARRDFIYVDDLAELMVSAVQQAPNGLHVLNAASGKSYSVREIVDITFELMGKTLPVQELGECVKITDTQADIGQSARLLNWTPKTDIRTGMKNLLLAESLLEE